MANRDITDLLFHLSSNDYKIKIKAIDELGRASSIEAYEALKLMLKRNNAILRPHLKAALAEIENSLKKNDSEIIDKINAAPAGEKKSGGLNYDVFARYLNDEEPKNRISVLSACAKIGRDPRLTDLLTERLAGESHPFVVASLLINLGRVGGEECVDIIASFLTHQDARIRANAVEGLDFLQAPRAILQILKAAGDSDPRVMANVARALLNVDNQYVENQLLAMLESGEQAQIDAANYVIGKIRFKFNKGPARESKEPVTRDGEIERQAVPAKSVQGAPAPERKKPPGAVNAAVYAMPAWPGYAALFIFSMVAAYAYYSFAGGGDASPVKGPPGPGRPDALATPDFGAYETELKSRIAAIAGEVERALESGKSREAFISLLQLKKNAAEHPHIKIYEAEIRMLEDEHRAALSILKQVPAQAKGARYFYLLASCYMRLGNLAEASAFAQSAVKAGGAGDRHAALAGTLLAEIRAMRENALKEAGDAVERSLKVFFGVLNAEGPRAVRPYFASAGGYELFEEAWRSVLLEVKQWRIDHAVLDVRAEAGAQEARVSARVLETWQYQNYGGICGVIYAYRDYYFIRTPREHSFDTGSVSLPLLVSGFGDAPADHERLEPYEEKQRGAMLMVCAARSAAAGITSQVELLRKAAAPLFEFTPAVLELASKPGALSKAEVENVIAATRKRSASDRAYDYFPGGPAVRSTVLDLAANCLLDHGDKKAHESVINEIIASGASYANAHFEKAMLRYAAGDTAECLRSIGEALKLEPDFAALESYFMPGQYAANADIMRRAEERLSQGLIDELEKLITEHPGYWRSYFNAGKLMIVLGADDRAEALFETALKLSPGNCSVLTKLALCCHRLKKTDLARKYCDEAEKLEPGNFQVKRTRAMLSR